MKFGAPWLTQPATRAVMAALAAGGVQAWFVGGCVRNSVLGAEATDIDIATDALPERVMALAETAGLQAVPTGVDHGTVTILADKVPFEITTLRRDVSTDGRRATVAYTDQLEEDAARRDFTINALYATAEGTVLDPLGSGLTDLAARRVRFIGEAEARIAEDYLRILRFFRFHAWYADPEGGLDSDGLAACAGMAEGLTQISRERIGAEMRKLLAAPDPAQAVAAMATSGILMQVLPGAEARGLIHLTGVEGDAPPDPIRRLAALVAQADDLRLSRRDLRQLAALRAGVEDSTTPGVLGYRHGAEAARDILLLRAALLEQPMDPGALAEIQIGAAAVFPVTAADLMPRFTGPELGAELSRLEDLWIASGFALDKAALLAR